MTRVPALPGLTVAYHNACNTTVSSALSYCSILFLNPSAI